MCNYNVVIVTGCFQRVNGKLHDGHIKLLQEAVKYGQIIVLLNSDAGVLKLKDYWMDSFRERRKTLFETGLVRFIIEFDTDPTNYIKLIRPDYIVAGDDHSLDEIMSKGGQFANEIILVPCLQETVKQNGQEITRKISSSNHKKANDLF